MIERRVGLGIAAILAISACNAIVGVEDVESSGPGGSSSGNGGNNGGMGGGGGTPCEQEKDCFNGVECLAWRCEFNECVSTVAEGQACGADMSMVCSKSGQCLAGLGTACNGDSACSTGVCTGGVCTLVPSCDGLLADCPSPTSGVMGSCCATDPVPEGSFNRNNGPMYPAFLSELDLDRFEVTVGRFRKFVNAMAGTPPMIGAGAHPHALHTGWDAGWNKHLPVDAVAYSETLLACDGGKYPAWTGNPAANEKLPINCVSWYEAFAFCAWDGGRLPSDLELNYVAAGGGEQRTYPWGTSAVDAPHAVYGCFGDPMMAAVCNIEDIRPVGSRSPVGDGRWGHSDLAGSMDELTFDVLLPLEPSICNDCVAIGAGNRVVRGGAWKSTDQQLTTTVRTSVNPATRSDSIGFRCARGLSVCGDGIVNKGEICEGDDPELGCKNCDKVAKVVAGDTHTCIVTQLGKLKCWGDNSNGQLGQGNNATSKDPALLPFIEIGRVVDVALSEKRTCALLASGNVQCFGADTVDGKSGLLGTGVSGNIGDGPLEMRNALSVTGLLEPATAVVSGRYHSCALLKDGTVQCWGFNDDGGRLGIGSNALKLGAGNSVFDKNTNLVLQIAASRDSTCALMTDNRVACWGVDTWGVGVHGVLGLNTAMFASRGSQLLDMTTGLMPTVLPTSFVTIGAISGGGGDHYCLAVDGLGGGRTASCWGANGNGQLGLGNRTHWGAKEGMTDMQDLGSVTMGMGFDIGNIVTGRTHTCVVSTDGRLKCFGDNGAGALGLGIAPPNMSSDYGVGDALDEMGDSLPEVDLGTDRVKQISLGNQSTCALFDNDRVKCWGLNDFGQAGVLPVDHGIGDNIIYVNGVLMIGSQLIKNIPYVDPL